MEKSVALKMLLPNSTADEKYGKTNEQSDQSTGKKRRPTALIIEPFINKAIIFFFQANLEVI